MITAKNVRYTLEHPQNGWSHIVVLFEDEAGQTQQISFDFADQTIIDLKIDLKQMAQNWADETLNEQHAAELEAKFIAARRAERAGWRALHAKVDEATREGRLIQYGQLPEYAPAALARDHFIASAKAFADHLIAMSEAAPAPKD